MSIIQVLLIYIFSSKCLSVKQREEIHLIWSPSLCFLWFKVREVSNKIMRGSSMTVLEDSAYSQMLVDWGQYKHRPRHLLHSSELQPKCLLIRNGTVCTPAENAEPCFPMQVTSQQCFKEVTLGRARQCWESCSFPEIQYETRDKLSSNDPYQFTIQFIIDFASVAQIMLDDSIFSS